MKRIILTALSIVLLGGVASAQKESRIKSKGIAISSKDGYFHKHEFTRHAVGDNDILIDILYSGICHSDIHNAYSHWSNESYPQVPGHEIAGKVIKVGKSVTKFKVGDYAGVGCMVNSCGECDNCRKGREQFCQQGKAVFTYGSKDVFHNNEPTMGGYSDNIVVSERFAVKIPQNADMKRVAPLLCAGITTYSPIKFSNIKQGDKVGVAGFGGLGHMAVQYLKAQGADVTVFDITEDKRQDAQSLGAVKYVNINQSKDFEGVYNTLDFIIVAASGKYDPVMYLSTLKEGGEMAIVGLPANEDTPMLNTSRLIFLANRKVYGSLIGGIEETQEMMDYSVQNNIYPIVEIIKADPAEIDKAYKNVQDGKVKFRYVIDMKTLK